MPHALQRPTTWPHLPVARCVFCPRQHAGDGTLAFVSLPGNIRMFRFWGLLGKFQETILHQSCGTVTVAAHRRGLAFLMVRHSTNAQPVPLAASALEGRSGIRVETSMRDSVSCVARAILSLRVAWGQTAIACFALFQFSRWHRVRGRLCIAKFN